MIDPQTGGNALHELTTTLSPTILSTNHVLSRKIMQLKQTRNDAKQYTRQFPAKNTDLNPCLALIGCSS